MASSAPIAPSPAAVAKREWFGSSWIASRPYDFLLLVFSPFLALGLAELLPLSDYPFERTEAFGGIDTRIGFFIAVWTSSHLIAVFFRSHANRHIFQQHRLRFTLIPLALFVAMGVSNWLLITGFVVGVLWDVYHTSMQNFGLCRIYDAKLGNDARVGRSLDMWANHFAYIGPLLCGLSLLATLDCFKEFRSLGWEAPARFLFTVQDGQGTFRWLVIGAGALFLVYYLAAYRRLVLNGYKVSVQKVLLLAAVLSSSILAWGFLPPIQALFVVNFYHGLQYFAIVWWLEKKNMREVFRFSKLNSGQWMTLGAYLLVLLLLGAGHEFASNSRLQWLMAASVLVSLMHFWYDGFIWSVRRKEV